MFRRFLTTVALAATVLPLHAADMPKELNFGIIATESTGALRQMWQPLVDDMSKQLGIKVNAFFAPDYAGVIEGMRFNKVQLGWFGNKSAIEAVDRAGGEVFAQQVDADGAPGYWSLLITHKDSGITSMDQVLKNKGKYTLGMGDPQSTSGFLVPGYYLFTQNDINPKTHFSTVRNANHETNIMAVLNRQVDVATNNTEQLDKLKQTFPERYAQIRVLWRSPLIPKDPLVWRKDMPDELKSRVRAFIVGYGKNEREKAILKAIYNTGSFRASSDAQLLPTRQLELARVKNKIEDDTTLSATEKKTQLDDVNAKLADLNRQLAATDK
ncbi:phosphonate ABC transporter substrate-binding protein [Chitiniphilus eburneus]|uniref:Phosphonate ABC transporter substrate-binding protein n=1 Tax=Chitiniphilus eburneus TaxID=2571148 RepID=A0A4U0PCX7_9NEIS|nr:phosphonate ABC transporter substrate-binding protein [Chitiniphilus eburneus]TJZ65439.1 phosphonate ABC transporter substrate-binding protein [Chitiniphilus eburneus]